MLKNVCDIIRKIKELNFPIILIPQPNKPYLKYFRIHPDARYILRI